MKSVEESYEKIRQLKSLIETFGREVIIEVDGGINLENVDQVIKAGANFVVAGSSIFKGGNPLNKFKALQQKAQVT